MKVCLSHGKVNSAASLGTIFREGKSTREENEHSGGKKIGL